MKALSMIALALVIIGALNWGLVGFFDYNVVDKIFGVGSTGAKVVYDVVGVAGLWALYDWVMRLNAE